jgi:hypothetical protein
MNLEDLSRMSEAELRAKANEKLKKLDVNLPQGYSIDEGPVLSEAQFFIDEIERRKQSWTGLRDLILEIVVILLIGAELIYGVWGGNQQLVILQTLKASADQQLVVLQNLNKSASETAKIMKALGDKQDVALATQQQTLQLTGQMNGALQTQLGLNFLPALTLIYDAPTKSLVFQNFGKTNLSLWGSKLGDEPRSMTPEPRIITPTAGYKFPVDDLLKVESQKVPKGTTETLRFPVYLKTANGKKYTATFLIIPNWKDDTLMLNVQLVGIGPENW